MEKQLSQLEQVLVQQLSTHDRLLAVIKKKLAALREANQERVMTFTRQENGFVQQIGELERERLKLVAELTRIVEPNAPAPIRLLELANRLDEPARGRLLVLRQQLNGKMREVQREARLTRRVTEALMRHFQGLIQTVGGATTGVGTYCRQGAPAPAALAISTLNTTA